MPKFNVEITRASWRQATVIISADSETEAIEKALATAGDIEFPAEKDAEYTATACPLVSAAQI